MAHELVELPYAVDALEPYVDAQTVQIHHGKHHAAYVTKLNAALEDHPDLQAKTLDALLADLASVPEEIRGAVRNNGGGVWNHNLFWEIMGPTPGAASAELKAAIDKAFGSMDAFRTRFSEAAVGRFGSGWAWLDVHADGSLCICSSPNQDSPIMKGVSSCEGTPILTLDVWEHAYYLKYQNRRPDYVAAWWNVVNWDRVSARYADAAKG